MHDLTDAVLTALSGSSAQQPMQVWEISGRLPSQLVPLEDITAALDDLVSRCAVGHVRTSPDGAQWRDIYWLTGIPPQPRGTSYRVPDIPPSTPRQENPMEAITHTESCARPGVVRDQVLRALAGVSEDAPLTVEQIAEQCPDAAGTESVRKCLQSLAGQGLIGRRVIGTSNKRRAVHWDISPAEPATATDSLPAEQADIVGLIRKWADPDSPSGSLVDAPAETAAPRARFALWDSGHLMLLMGDEYMILAPGDVRRLTEYLGRCGLA